MHNFEKSLALTLKFEGGFVDNPFDPGGATNMGITLSTLSNYRGHTASKLDVKRLTQTEASAIYLSHYWEPLLAEQLPDGVDMFMFDYAVNSGPARAVIALQSILGLLPDGSVKVSTLRESLRQDPATLIRALASKRLGFLQRLRSFQHFGRGWKTRVDAVTSASLELCHSRIPSIPAVS